MDYAKVSLRDQWLRHPALGDPSFDTFEKVGPTVHRSEYPYEWTVNGSLFIDFDGTWYLYAGLYPLGYMDRPGCYSHFEIYKSADKGQTWTWLGPGLHDSFVFEGVSSPSTGCPDAVLYYDARRKKYLLTYDWGTDNATWFIAHNYVGTGADAGAAVAWADSPAGPFERVARPVFLNSQLHGRYGRFDRFYATTVIPRKNDYLALMLCDSGPSFAWGLAGATASAPEEGFSMPKMLLSADLQTYYPTPVEFYPAFVVGDTVYAPATSVCANRSYQALFAAPLEEAHRPEAWKLAADGGLWHARPLSDEHYGIFGQTFSGVVDGDGLFRVMYPSRDERGWGTLMTASRPWDRPYSDGFTLSGHAAPSITLLRRMYKTFTLEAEFDLHGGFADVLFDFAGRLGADRPASDCAPNDECLTKYAALRVSGPVWTLMSGGEVKATGRVSRPITAVRLERGPETLRAAVNGECVLDVPCPVDEFHPVGLRTDRFTVLNCSRFDVEGESRPAVYRFTDVEALQGGGVGDNCFTMEDGRRRGAARVKWSAYGSSFELTGRRAPGLGRAVVRVDGKEMAEIDFSAEKAQDGPIYATPALAYGPHGVELIPTSGEIIVPDIIARA